MPKGYLKYDLTVESAFLLTLTVNLNTNLKLIIIHFKLITTIYSLECIFIDFNSKWMNYNSI